MNKVSDIFNPEDWQEVEGFRLKTLLITVLWMQVWYVLRLTALSVAMRFDQNRR